MPSTPTLLIGAHTSAAGGVQNALFEGKEIEATTVQLFTRNQKRWDHKPVTEEEIVLFQSAMEETGLSHIMSHDSYLINLGGPSPENLKKSKAAFKDEILRCQALGITYLNFHPGATLDSSEEECLDRIIESLEELIPVMEKSKTRLLIETTAGQGSSVGYRFEHIAYLTGHLHKKLPIGVCIDTCHIFAAGYDIRTAEDVEIMLHQFDQIVGLEHLYAFHLNDSMKKLGSRVDRHAPLGKGEIGLECFKTLMNHTKTKHLPKYLETPDGPPLWKEEIRMLKNFAK